MTELLAIEAEATELRDAARALAAEWGFRLDPAPDQEYVLRLTGERLELCSRKDPRSGSVFVDWAGGAAAHRRLFGGGRGQPLARAVGLKAGATPTVLDATAGFGRDAFVLACLGCRVTLLERHPAVAALLQDGWRRACADAEIGALVRERMRVIHGDARQWLAALPASERPDVVYLDPMYPERRKSSLVKKEMRALQELLGKDPHAGELLPVALAAARQRVVVKRPMGAEALNHQPPTMSIKGKQHRYDVYVTKVLAHDT
ncbi:MAG: class I SAM-dependent methyltransferase [Gammaproteobacteria bacterium]|nr:class I SAM-dependent methyltransferase [Gammaproteobacteria bacterium]